jgi:multisubunit Na+/H+ antiporter MnhG subunit
MSGVSRKTTPAALVAIGIMFIVIGLNSGRLLILAGVVFLIAAIIQHRTSQSSVDGPKE